MTMQITTSLSPPQVADFGGGNVVVHKVQAYPKGRERLVTFGQFEVNTCYEAKCDLV